jgi:hypothetical protein
MAKDLPTPIVDQNWWTDDVDAVAGTSAGWVAHNDTDGSVSPFKAGNVAGLLFPFRCVKSPGD